MDLAPAHQYAYRLNSLDDPWFSLYSRLTLPAAQPEPYEGARFL